MKQRVWQRETQGLSVTAGTDPQFKPALFLELKTQSSPHLTKPAFWNRPLVIWTANVRLSEATYRKDILGMLNLLRSSGPWSLSESNTGNVTQISYCKQLRANKKLNIFLLILRKQVATYIVNKWTAFRRNYYGLIYRKLNSKDALFSLRGLRGKEFDITPEIPNKQIIPVLFPLFISTEVHPNSSPLYSPQGGDWLRLSW